MKMRKLFRLASLLAFLSTSQVFAGEYFEKDGAAIQGYDPVAYFKEGKAHAGNPAITHVYKGSTFRFASPENRDEFAKNSEKFAPQYNGFCAYGVAKGAKAKIEPEAFAIVNNKLYLNYDKDIAEKWHKDVPGFITKADENWSTVSKLTKVVQ